jgi:hypothetical protein
MRQAYSKYYNTQIAIELRLPWLAQVPGSQARAFRRAAWCYRSKSSAVSKFAMAAPRRFCRHASRNPRCCRPIAPVLRSRSHGDRRLHRRSHRHQCQRIAKLSLRQHAPPGFRLNCDFKMSFNSLHLASSRPCIEHVLAMTKAFFSFRSLKQFWASGKTRYRRSDHGEDVLHALVRRRPREI